MRSLLLFLCALLGLAASGFSQANVPGPGVAAFRDGSYEASIPLLQAECEANRRDTVAAADLLSALVNENRTDEAMSLAEDLAAAFPDSPEVLAARGDLAFFLGDMSQADRLYLQALKRREETARAYFGLYRLYRSASIHYRARLALMRANALDADDAAIRMAWFSILTPEKKKEEIEKFLKSHPGADEAERLSRDNFNGSELAKALNGRRANLLVGDAKPATVHLAHMMDSPTHSTGLSVELNINGGKRLKLLLDTGASGILIHQRAADRVGLAHVGSHETWGIGDKGVRKAYLSMADTCSIGSLEYQNCIIDVVEGGRLVGYEDGLIGADFFSAFVVDLDFRQQKMSLSPLPPRPPNAQGYDRVLTPGFTPIFRFGHSLMIPTKVNDSRSGLFLIDTGASISNIDREFAEESMKIHDDQYMHVKGISGSVKRVFEAEKATIQFATFRQQNLGMTVFDLNNSGKHPEVRMAGILGMPVLAYFHLTLDYRNGQVKFDYQGR